MQIRRVAQSYFLGNQAKIVPGTHMNVNQQKNFIGNNISGFTVGHIEVTNRLDLKIKVGRYSQWKH